MIHFSTFFPSNVDLNGTLGILAPTDGEDYGYFRSAFLSFLGASGSHEGEKDNEKEEEEEEDEEEEEEEREDAEKAEAAGPIGPTQAKVRCFAELYIECL